MPVFTWKGHSKEWVDLQVKNMVASIVYPEKRGGEAQYHPTKDDSPAIHEAKAKKREEYQKQREKE